jgi:hypothetical protein
MEIESSQGTHSVIHLIKTKEKIKSAISNGGKKKKVFITSNQVKYRDKQY